MLVSLVETSLNILRCGPVFELDFFVALGPVIDARWWFIVHLFHTIYIKLTYRKKYCHNTWLQDKIIIVQIIKCVWWSK